MGRGTGGETLVILWILEGRWSFKEQRLKMPWDFDHKATHHELIDGGLRSPSAFLV